MFEDKSNAALDYFICYSGKDMSVGSSMFRFADALYDRLTGCGKRVYFAPRMGQGDAYNSTDALKKMISGLNASFIVLLSPRFFDDFDEQTEDRESPVKKEIAIALAEAKRRSRDGSGVKAFLKYVHINGFAWQRSQKYIVHQLFAGYPMSTYFDVGAFVCSVRSADAESDAVSNDAIDTEVREFVKKHLDIDIDRENSISLYKRNLDLCFHTMVVHAQQFFSDQFLEYAQSFKTAVPALLTNYKAFDKKLSLYGLHSSVKEDTRATSWPVFYTDMAKFADADDAGVRCSKLRRFQVSDSLDKDAMYSTCAVCFGALHIYNTLESNYAKEGVNDYTNAYFNECLRGAINLLMFMQNELGSWPEQKQLGKPTDLFEADNGLNQTTIAISTLLKMGFLQAENPIFGSASAEVLGNRRDAIIKATEWLLLGASHVETDEIAYWNIDGEQDGSTLMTAMCMDSYIKLLKEPIIAEQISVATDFNGLFIKMTNFFAQMQNDDGGIRPSLSNPHSSFSHTAKVMNTLCTLWEFTKNTDCKEVAGDVINKCLPYLTDIVTKLLSDEKQQADFEKFNIPECENYEMSGEMLLITALTKILKSKDNLHRLLSFEHYAVYKDAVARERLANRLAELMNKYTRENVEHYLDITATEAILIRGNRKDETQQHPIYLLYYYRMALAELLSAFEQLSGAAQSDTKRGKDAA